MLFAAIYSNGKFIYNEPKILNYVLEAFEVELNNDKLETENVHDNYILYISGDKNNVMEYITNKNKEMNAK